MTRPSPLITRLIRRHARPPAIWYTFGLENAVRRMWRERRKCGERRVDGTMGARA
jgi:hypothetical protein